jgi:hypothetical protein
MRKNSRSISRLDMDRAWLETEFPCGFLVHVLGTIFESLSSVKHTVALSQFKLKEKC